MEEEIHYEKIKEDRDLVNKKYKYLNSTFMTNYNKGKDIVKDNSNLKYNQINTIDKYGLFYFYNESGIYFISNSHLKCLIINKNKDISYTDLFFLKCDNIYNVFLLEHEESGKIYLIICTKNPEEYSFLIYISVKELIEAMNKQKDIYDIKIIQNLEDKESKFAKGYFTRAIDEIDKNIELNEEGIYGEEHMNKKLTPKEKEELFIEEKKEELEQRNEIFKNAYKKSNKYKIDKVVYLDENFEEIIIIDYDNYIVRYNNGEIIFYKNYERTRIFEVKSLKMSYNPDNNIFLILTKDSISIFKEKDNFTLLEKKKQIPLKNILSAPIEEEKIIYIKNIFNFIILYSIENKEEPEKQDKLYFIQMNSNINDIVKIYLEKEFFYPDEYDDFEGISYISHLKKPVFTVYDKDINVLFVINKHMDLLDKYYGFKKMEEDFYDLLFFDLNDDQKLNSRIPELDKFENDLDIQKLKANPFVGISIIKFKFDSYNDDQEMINGEYFISPYLMFTLGYYGGFKVFYILNELQQKDDNIEYKLANQNDLFRKANNINNKSLRIVINEEIAETEKEKFLYDSKKKDSFQEMLNIKKLNLRNIFLHELDSQIKDNLNKIKKRAYSERMKIDLIKLGKIAKNKIFEDIRKNINDLIKNAEDVFNEEEQNQIFIKNNKEITEQNKNFEKNIKNIINNIEDNKNKFKELNLNVNSPINLILTHPKLKLFFGENEINSMIKFYNEVKSNINLFQNHTNLIERLNEINNNLIQKIEKCKKNYITKKEYGCLKKRKDFNEVKKKVQNNTFIMYMKILYEFFWDLYQFKENEMTEELNNLTELKREYNLINNQYEEEKNNIDNDYNINNNENKKKRKRFLLRQEEDIDEGNYINNNNDNDQRLVLANENSNISIINNKVSKNVLIEREKKAIVNKLFNINLVKEKKFEQRNKFSEILSNFEGRISLYDESNEKDNCINAEDLFSDFLKNEQEKELEEKKAKALKEQKEKEKKDKINFINKSVNENNKEREKIEKELKKIEDDKKAEIIEKEKEIKELKNLLESFKIKFEENKSEREKEKKRYMNELEKRNNEGQRKIDEEKNKTDERIKKMEKDLEEYKNKLSQEEQKRKEFEEKNKQLAEEIRNNVSNNNNNNNNNNLNVLNDNNKQPENKFLQKDSNVQNKKDNNENKENDKSSVFEELNLNPAQSINNIILFTSNKNDNNNKEDKNKNDGLNDLFKDTNTTITNTHNIFSTLENKQNQQPQGIFANISVNNQNQNQNNQPNININKPKENNIFSTNQNTSNQGGFANIFSGISFNNVNNNPTQNQGQSGGLFGQHQLSLGQTNERRTIENTNPITLSFGNNQNNNNNSPFLAFGNAGGGLFGNNNAGNNQNNNGNDDFFK